MELPNNKTLPYYAIAVLVMFVGGLLAHIVEQEKDFRSERQEHSQELAQCRKEAINAARDIDRKLNMYLMLQDSLNRATDKKIKQRK